MIWIVKEQLNYKKGDKKRSKVWSPVLICELNCIVYDWSSIYKPPHSQKNNVLPVPDG